MSESKNQKKFREFMDKYYDALIDIHNRHQDEVDEITKQYIDSLEEENSRYRSELSEAEATQTKLSDEATKELEASLDVDDTETKEKKK